MTLTNDGPMCQTMGLCGFCSRNLACTRLHSRAFDFELLGLDAPACSRASRRLFGIAPIAAFRLNLVGDLLDNFFTRSASMQIVK